MVGILLASSVLTASPADAHDVSSLLTNYQTNLLSVSPEIDGIAVAVIEDGNRMEASNETDTELTVLGYDGEPYLRIGPDGVFQNLNSPATYLNEERDGQVPVPERADAEADPEWEHIGDEPLARWHDHRVHWMSPNDAPAVRDAPDERHVIQEWVLPMRHGDERIEAAGELVWVPGPSPAPWAALVLLVGGGLTAAALLPVWRWAAAGGVVALLAIAIASSLGLGFYSPGTTDSQVAEALADALYLPALAVGVVASLVLLARRHPVAPYLVVFTGAVGGFFGGVLQATALTNSVVPSALTVEVARALVAGAIGLGLGLLGLGILAVVREPTASPAGQPETATSPSS
ncbi:MAG: hypothetical protein U5R31_04180 [Acidimicrobiia bacterium]|nr:hypothetical protein [Acidimicrobiia bacterium]